MCLAVYKPAGLDIPEKNLRAGFENNNDGCGLCWAADGQLHVERGMLTWDAFYGLYLQASQYPMLIHFRKATHGKKNEDNCHPFLFNDGELALIHNGVLPIKCSEEGFSDTWHFVHKVLEPMVKERGVPIDDQALSWFIRVSIGTDKVAIMNKAGEVVIFNEEKGNWEDTDGPEGKKGKVWFSNYSFRSYPHTTTYPNRSTYSSANHSPSVPAHRRDEDENANAEWEGYGYTPEKAGGAASDVNVDAQIADDATRGPGKMTEYGWFDTEIEEEITQAQTKGMSRVDAIVHVFNNA
jgi:hypothetical protein